jgi:hypothetical protein
MYAGSNVVLLQSQVESNPKEHRLRIGVVVGVLVVFTITCIAGRLQFKLASGSVLGSTNVVPH